MVTATLTPNEVDGWPLLTSGLGPRVVRCSLRVGLQTVGDLRSRLDGGQRVPGLGRKARQQANEFFTRTAASLPVTLREWLAALLTPTEMAVVELRYGLTDRLWRPTMRLCPYRVIAAELNTSPARVCQICRGAHRKLESRLGRAVARGLRLPARRPELDLREWRGQDWLAGYEPWGALELLGEIQ